ncbi:MAG TPA: hypothetical protein VJ872_04650 [Nocardioides sp.]|nr:hypothetical protein [Nocardioides sp.]
MTTPPSRDRLRKVLLLAGVLPGLVALLFAAMVLRILAVQHSGNNAYDDGHYLDAAGHYRLAGHLNPFQDWLAAFDAGAARHVDGEYAVAIRAYRAALDLGVPHQDECTVRINLALAEEAIGDAATKADRLNAANDAYQAGISALEDGHCPTDSGRGAQQTKDAKAVDDRLHKKTRQNKKQQQKQQQEKKRRQQQEKNKTPQQRQQEQRQRQQQKREQQQREQKLNQQNKQGLQDRKSQQNRDGGAGYQPNW